jgi:hypothetical protein
MGFIDGTEDVIQIEPGASHVCVERVFAGLEITTGGQRLHRRADLERALHARRISPGPFESHLATLYPRGRYHVTP